MMGSSHLTTGVTTASWTAAAMAAAGVPPALALLSIPVGAYAALLPDIDHHGSRITWCLPPISNIASWVLRGCPYDFAIPITGPAFYGHLAPWNVRHRYETHTKTGAAVFGLALGLPLALIPGVGWWWPVFAVQIAIGCLTHRWGDMRTTGGLPAPDRRRKTIGRTFDVNSPHEHWLRGVVYRPIAITSVIAALLMIAWISGGKS